MFKDKELEYVKRAFQIERDSYNNTIKYLRGKVDAYEAELDAATNTTIKDLADETIKQLEIKNRDLEIKNRDLADEVARLEKELSECGKKLNATQYKEYKRLKQAEYTRRWLKKKQAQAKK